MNTVIHGTSKEDPSNPVLLWDVQVNFIYTLQRALYIVLIVV